MKRCPDFAERCIRLLRKLVDKGMKPLEIVTHHAKTDRFAKACSLIWIAALTAAFLYSLAIPLRYFFVVIGLAVALRGLPFLEAPRHAPKWIAMFFSLVIPVSRAIIVVMLMAKLAILIWNSQGPSLPIAAIDVGQSSRDWHAGCELAVGSRVTPAHGPRLIQLPSAKSGHIRWRFEGPSVPMTANVEIKIVGPSSNDDDEPRCIADGEVTGYPGTTETWFVESIDGGDDPFRLVIYSVD